MRIVPFERLLAQCVPAILLVCSLSCKQSQSVEIPAIPAAPPPYSWKTSTLQQQGLSKDSIDLASDDFHTKGYVESFLVVRNGFLVREDYYTVLGKYTNASIASVSKSVASALVGIALREGNLDSLGQKLLDFFPEYVTQTMDPRKHAITIEHLLTMRSGIDYVETADHSNIFNTGTNWMKEALNLPLRSNPGESFNYASVNAHLMSGILTKATHGSLKDFAERFLFTPLGITILSWPQDPQYYYFAGSGMVFYPRDLARFGHLYLSGGHLDGHEILPAEWVRTSTAPHDDQTRTWGDFSNVRYGYFWWTAQLNSDSVFLAVGFGGQFIICVPRTNLVIVVTSNLDCTNEEADIRHTALLNVIARKVLTAIQH